MELVDNMIYRVVKVAVVLSLLLSYLFYFSKFTSLQHIHDPSQACMGLIDNLIFRVVIVVLVIESYHCC